MGLWHAECYTKLEGDNFPVLGRDDLDDSFMGEDESESEDVNRFQVARNGDSMMVPFQCDKCHFMNIQGREPRVSSHQDNLMLLALRRVILDSFWSRETSTVLANFREGQKEAKIKRTLGMEDRIFRRRGPFPLEDAWGVAEACCVVWRSLDAGKNTKRVQFDTVWKMRTFQSNYAHAGMEGTGAVFMNSDGTSARVSNSPTNSVWFNRFMMGMHKRMGDVNKPDMAVDRYVIRGCFEVAQDIWDNNPMDVFARKEIEKAICIVISGYFGGLRGEEIAKGDRGAMMERWKDSMSHEETPFVPLTLLGRFKRETGEKVFCQPLAAVTKGGRSLEI